MSQVERGICGRDLNGEQIAAVHMKRRLGSFSFPYVLVLKWKGREELVAFSGHWCEVVVVRKGN